MTLCVLTLTGCATSNAYNNQTPVPPLPASVRNGGWVVTITDMRDLNSAQTKELFAKVRANELRQARAVRNAQEYHRQLERTFGGK